MALIEAGETPSGRYFLGPLTRNRPAGLKIYYFCDFSLTDLLAVVSLLVFTGLGVITLTYCQGWS